MLHTILVILEQTMLHLPLMLGAYVSFSLLKVSDLSIETAHTVGALCGSYALAVMGNMPISFCLIGVIIASLLGGAMVGLVSSALTQKGGFPHLLSSIVTFGLFHGINQYLSPVYVSLSSMQNPLMIGAVMPQHPECMMIVLIGLIITLLIYFLSTTQLGYAHAVYGQNPYFFRQYGICTSYIFISGIMIANALAGLSGYLIAQSNNFVELNMGIGKALCCITALVIGKSLITAKKPFSISIAVAGTLAYFTLQQMLLKVGFNLKYFTAVQAVLVLCLLLYTYRTQPRRSINDNLGL
jgi:putative ABC transport system permease protein